MEKLINNARAAAKSLKTMPVKERLKPIRALKRIILEQREKIMDQIQQETGKCRSDALMSEIFGVLDHLEYLDRSARKILSDRKVKTPLALMGKKSVVYLEPLGVVFVISPWNYPFYQAIVPCTLSFITGNATIYKPSEHTPLKMLVERLFKEADFPENALQIVYGAGEIGKKVIDLKPDKVFFTGGVKTGKSVMEQASRQLIPVELELGGKDPMIVFEDVNIQRAVSGAVWGALTNCGQSCTSVERLYVQEGIFEKFKEALISEVSRIKQTMDSDGDSDIGEMTVPFQVKHIKRQLDKAVSMGAEQVTGNNWDGEETAIPPIVLENVSADMEIGWEETFGPVIPLFRFKTEEEVIELANNSPYGLSASVWSKNLKRAVRVARALHTGNVSINNVMLTEGNHELPFGGVKNSGFGRYKGEFGYYSFSNIKSVLIDKNSSKIEANWYPYTAQKYRLFTDMMVGLFSGGIKNLIRFALAGMKLESYSNKVGKSGRSP